MTRRAGVAQPSALVTGGTLERLHSNVEERADRSVLTHERWQQSGLKDFHGFQVRHAWCIFNLLVAACECRSDATLLAAAIIRALCQRPCGRPHQTRLNARLLTNYYASVMRAACKRPQRAFPVRCRSTLQVPDAAHANTSQTAPRSDSAPNFMAALERRYTDEQARYVPAETSPARREAMKLFSARVTSNLTTNLPAARNYYELAKALKCLTPELCEKTLPIALRENDRRWTVAIYSDWEALAPGQIPIASVAGAFRALAPFCLWSRLSTILESLAVRGLRLPDSSVVPAMRGASAGTHPDAHAFVLTAMRLGYAAPGLLDAAMRRSRPCGFSEQRTNFFIQAMQENDLPSSAALQHYCDVLTRSQEYEFIVKLLLAAKKLMPLNTALLFHLVEAAAHRKDVAILEAALDQLRQSNASIRRRTVQLVVASAVVRY